MERLIAGWVEGRMETPVHAVEPVAAGLGATEMWRVRRLPGAADLLFRRFGGGSGGWAHREEVAMRAARAGGVPVPEVLARDVLDGRPFLLLAWVDGVPAREALLAAPADAEGIGERLGETLGRIHRVDAPDGLSPAAEWIQRGGPALAPLRDRLDCVPNADRLLHLDFHPLNVLMASGAVTGVIDWTNTLSGPPHMDLARSRAILLVAGMVMHEQEGFVDLMRAYEAGLLAGHARIAGPDPHPALSEAWGLAMTIEDIAGHVAKPGSGITLELLDALRRDRDARIASALTSSDR